MQIDYHLEDSNAYKPLEAKAHWNIIALDPRDLPVDQIIRDLAEQFRDGDLATRQALRAKYAGNRNLLTFAHRRANQMLRNVAAADEDENVACLSEGLTAMLLENCLYNYRESLSYGGMLRYSADQCQIEFGEVAEPLLQHESASSKTSELLKYFAAMPPGKASLTKLYMKTSVVEGKTQVEFR